MSKLVQKVKWNLDGLNTEMYMYGEADFEANKAMQEPLEKLYKHENSPDIREKIREYTGKLETEIKRCEQFIIDNNNETENMNNILFARIQTIQEVINDLKSRLEERV